MILWILLGIVVLIVLWVITAYNGLITLRNQVDEGWSNIDVQLKRRYDLIPNLVNTVKGYATHEKGVFEAVTAARSAAMGATGPADTAAAENMLTGALKSLFALAEAYPDLKANQNFAQLQTDLVDTEDKIQASRRFYNGAVRDLNTKIQMFPTNMFASLLGFKTRDFFEVENQAEVEKAVDVKF